MPAYLTNALSAIQEIDDNSRIRNEFEGLFIKNAKTLYNWTTIDELTKRKLSEMLELKTVDPSSTFRGHYVGLCSVFELFCKNMIEHTITQKITAAKKFENLDPRIVVTSIQHVGRYLNNSRDQYLQGEVTFFEKLSDNLNTLRTGSVEYVINSDLICSNLGNCTPDKLEAKYLEIGFPSPFSDALGGYAAMKKWGQNQGARAVSKLAKKTLKEIIVTRNKLTHPDGTSIRIVINDIENASVFFRALLPAMSAHADTC